jgi:hypothetical protein
MKHENSIPYLCHYLYIIILALKSDYGIRCLWFKEGEGDRRIVDRDLKCTCPDRIRQAAEIQSVS